MAHLPTLILHGWSDTSASFKPMGEFLRAQGVPVTDIFLGDYLSLFDEITPYDLGQAMGRALAAKQIPTARHSFNVVLHSTGGLVVREFLRQFCRDAQGRPQAALSPIRNILMLAPANFGSPIARLGKSMAGRLFKGWKWDGLFQTGAELLHALEVGSPYGFKLAEADLFDPAFPIFDPAHVVVTVLVGTNAFSNVLKQIAHVNGSDGTVCVATASLNARLVAVDFAAPNAPVITERRCTAPEVALGVFDRDHSTICRPEAKAQQAEWRRLVLAALTVDAAGYARHVAACAAVTRETFTKGRARRLIKERRRFHEYQNVVFRVCDQYGHPINDYFIEFYQDVGDPRDRVAAKVHGEILEDVKVHTQAANHRSFYFDITDLRADQEAHPELSVQFSIVAAHPSERIRYRNPTEAPGVGITVFDRQRAGLLRPNSTLLIDLTLYRDPTDAVFTMKGLD